MMANFPDEIQVMLGDHFAPGGLGLGLTRGETYRLTRLIDSGDSQLYSEDGTNTPSAGNRIKVGLSRNNFQLRMYLNTVSASSLATAFLGSISAFTPATYTFRDLWLGNMTTGLGFSYSQMKFYPYTPANIGSNGAGSSWSPTTTGTKSGTQLTIFNPKLFSTFEEFVPSLGPDKTTYRHG